MSTERVDDLLDRVTPMAKKGSAEGGGQGNDSAFRQIDAVKIDTDGDDFAVLVGMAELIERDHPLVVVELAAHEAEIVAWLRERYDHVVGMHGEAVLDRPWPPNVFGWNQKIEVQRAR